MPLLSRLTAAQAQVPAPVVAVTLLSIFTKNVDAPPTLLVLAVAPPTIALVWPLRQGWSWALPVRAAHSRVIGDGGWLWRALQNFGAGRTLRFRLRKTLGTGPSAPLTSH